MLRASQTQGGMAMTTTTTDLRNRGAVLDSEHAGDIRGALVRQPHFTV